MLPAAHTVVGMECENVWTDEAFVRPRTVKNRERLQLLKHTGAGDVSA